MPPERRDHSTSSSSTKRLKRSRKAAPNKSIWTSKDDWDTLVSESALSTSSISSRPPRCRTFPTLASCAKNAVARSFKSVWGQEGEIGDEWRKWWKRGWDDVPWHMREGVRDAVYGRWSGLVSIQLIHDIFTIPPNLFLPGELLPSISKATRLKTLIPPTALAPLFTTLTLTHSPSSTDLGIAGVIHFLPNLETINLKGCSLVGEKTVKTILGRCPNLKKINLKGTKIGEKEVAHLLDKFGNQLVVFKVDNVIFDYIDSTFSSQPYPKITHLCLPGNILNRPLSSVNRNTTRFTGMGYPKPRPTPDFINFHWSSLKESFPSLTHLYLPGLLLPPLVDIATSGLDLVKLAIGPRGPPVPIESIIPLLINHKDTLRSLQLGNIVPSSVSTHTRGDTYKKLTTALCECAQLEDFRWQTDTSGTNNSLCDAAVIDHGGDLCDQLFISEACRSLKRVLLEVPFSINLPYDLIVEDLDVASRPLETFDIPNANISNHHDLAQALALFPKLRSLDLSGTTIDDDDMKLILGKCPLLSRVDLTSCRGINVRHRRNIFKAIGEDSG